MPISISYALFPLANHRVLSTTTLLSTPSLRLSLHCTALTNPLESSSTFQLRSKTMSSRDQVTEFRQQVHCYSVFTWILLHCVLFLFASTTAAAANLNQPQRSWEDEAKSLLRQRTDEKAPADGIYRADSITYLTPSALACYVSFVTGNKRKLDEETQ